MKCFEIVFGGTICRIVLAETEQEAFQKGFDAYQRILEQNRRYGMDNMDRDGGKSIKVRRRIMLEEDYKETAEA